MVTYCRSPQLCSLVSLERLTNIEHIIQSLFKQISFWCSFFDPDLTMHSSNIGVWLRKVTEQGLHNIIMLEAWTEDQKFIRKVKVVGWLNDFCVGAVDVLVNNAGSAQISALEDYANADDFRKSVVSATGRSWINLDANSTSFEKKKNHVLSINFQKWRNLWYKQHVNLVNFMILSMSYDFLCILVDVKSFQ
jgi:hypothetical protein